MAISRHGRVLLGLFLLFTSVIATQLAERTTNQGYGMLLGIDEADGCPSYTIDCEYQDVCCPVGSFCFGGVFQGVCCPTNSDCSSAVMSKPTCANSSWALFDTTTSPASLIQKDYLFCCDAGHVGVQEGQCWPTGNSETVSQLASTIVPGKATATAASGAATGTGSTKKSLGIKHDENRFLCFGMTAIGLLVGLL